MSNIEVDISTINLILSIENPTISVDFHFSDFNDTLWEADENNELPNGYITKCSSYYNNERRLFDNLLTEAFNQHGVYMTYYVTSWNMTYDKIWGEDNNRNFIRAFNFMGYYTLPREDKLWTKFGVEGLDTFSMYVSKLHFKEASTFDKDGHQDVFIEYIPKVGDIIMVDYNKYIYEITEVKEEVGMFLLSKQHMWEFVVKTFKDEHIAVSENTSACEIKDYTNKTTDIFDIKSAIDDEKSSIKYSPKSNEKNNDDPFAGW